MPLTRPRALAPSAVRTLLALLILFAITLWAGAAGASAHTGAAFCHGDLALSGHGAEGTCKAPFQGFPIGVLGEFDAGDPAGHAEIHVEVFAELSTGFARPLGIECESDGYGAVRCEESQNPFGMPLTAPEPVPAEIVALSCRAHSHAHGNVPGATPSGRFACWSSEEARDQLAEDGFPREDSGGEEPPAASPLPGLPGSENLSSVITTVPVNTYLPSVVLVDRSLGLTYLNLDLNRHDVVAWDATRPDGSAPWCSGYAPGKCPLFRSPLITTGQQAEVSGIEDAEPGAYTFFCSLHPYMKGTINVVS